MSVTEAMRESGWLNVRKIKQREKSCDEEVNLGKVLNPVVRKKKKNRRQKEVRFRSVRKERRREEVMNVKNFVK